MTNQRLYNGLPRISTVIHNRRLALAGHVMPLDEMAREVLLWQPGVKYRIVRPSLTIKNIIKEDVGLHDLPTISTIIIAASPLLVTLCVLTRWLGKSYPGNQTINAESVVHH